MDSTTPSISSREIQEKGLAKVYPAPVDQVWAASLDVISQYTAIFYASRAEGLLVFSHVIALPKEITQAESQQVEVLLALSMVPRGQDGSTVFATFPADQPMTLTSVPDLSKKGDETTRTQLQRSSAALAAGLVADRLFGHLATQLFYKDRWKGKFTLRLPVKRGVVIIQAALNKGLMPLPRGRSFSC
jgi:hypothetical protein